MSVVGLDPDDLGGLDIMYRSFSLAAENPSPLGQVFTYKQVQVLTDPVPFDARAAAYVQGKVSNAAEGPGAIGKYEFFGRIRDEGEMVIIQPNDPCNPTYATNTGMNNQLVSGHLRFVTEEGLRPKKFGYVQATVQAQLIGGQLVPIGYGTVTAITPNASITKTVYEDGKQCPDLKQTVMNGGVGNAGGPHCPGSGPQPALDPGPYTAIYQGAYGAGAGSVVENGNYPESILRRVSTEHATAAIKLLADVVDDFNRLAAAFHAGTGSKLKPNGGMRCYSGGKYCQVETKCRKGRKAATPGRSQHGWGVAFDYDSGGFSGKAYKWMIANSYKYNWIHPSWAKPKSEGGSNPEAWHMEHSKKNSFITAKKKSGGRPRPTSATESAVANNEYPMGTTRTDTDGPGPVGGGEWVEGKNFAWVDKPKNQWKEIPVA